MQTLLLLACTASKESALDDSAAVESEPNESQPQESEPNESTPDSDSPTDSDSPPDTAPPGDIEISGSWVDNFGVTHNISNMNWTSGSSRYNITAYDNDLDFAVGQNDAINPTNPGLWSRFDWTSDGSNYYFCQTTSAAETSDMARDTPAADATSLETGCGGLAWTKLMIALEIRGLWVDEWGTTHAISEVGWEMSADWGASNYAVTQYNNGVRNVIAQNDAANTYNPGLWSRFDWAYDGRDYYYCQSTYDAATEADALAAVGADPGNIATGCGGFSWTKLLEVPSIFGAYTDSWGGTHTITETLWDMGPTAQFEITYTSNRNLFLVAHNASTNDWFPDLWSRFDWTYDAGRLYYCQIADDAATEDEALGIIAADRGNIAGGCNGFSWTELIP